MHTPSPPPLSFPCTQCDCSMVEVNPLAQVTDHEVMCLDAKLNFDDNAAFRQTAVFEKRDTTQENKASTLPCCPAVT